MVWFEVSILVICTRVNVQVMRAMGRNLQQLRTHSCIAGVLVQQGGGVALWPRQRIICEPRWPTSFCTFHDKKTARQGQEKPDVAVFFKNKREEWFWYCGHAEESGAQHFLTLSALCAKLFQTECCRQQRTSLNSTAAEIMSTPKYGPYRNFFVHGWRIGSTCARVVARGGLEAAGYDAMKFLRNFGLNVENGVIHTVLCPTGSNRGFVTLCIQKRDITLRSPSRGRCLWLSTLYPGHSDIMIISKFGRTVSSSTKRACDKMRCRC